MMMSSSRPIPAALRPPPNTPLTPTFPNVFTPFILSLSTPNEETLYHEDDVENTDPYTLSTYGLLTPTESYISAPSASCPTTSSLSFLSSPKRHPHGCLRLRQPIPRPPLPKRNGTYGRWSCPRIVIGCEDSEPSLPVETSPTSKTKPPYPGFLRSPSSSPSQPLVTPNSPAPLPIPLPLPLTDSNSFSNPSPLPANIYEPASDLASDSDTEVEPEVEDDVDAGDTSSSDTCASDSDSEEVLGYPDIKGKMMMLKSELGTKPKSTKRPPIPRWD